MHAGRKEMNNIMLTLALCGYLYIHARPGGSHTCTHPHSRYCTIVDSPSCPVGINGPYVDGSASYVVQHANAAYLYS